MAAKLGLECEVLDQESMAKLGMGALLGVAQGSSNPPFLISSSIVPPEPKGKISLRWSAKASPSTPAESPSNPPTAWKR